MNGGFDGTCALRILVWVNFYGCFDWLETSLDKFILGMWLEPFLFLVLFHSVFHPLGIRPLSSALQFIAAKDDFWKANIERSSARYLGLNVRNMFPTNFDRSDLFSHWILFATKEGLRPVVRSNKPTQRQFANEFPLPYFPCHLGGLPFYQGYPHSTLFR